MKVVINATSAKIGGSANHLTHLLRNLCILRGSHNFIVFLPLETTERLGTLPGNIQVHSTDIGHGSWWRRLWWEQATLRRFLKKENADLLFNTGSFGMLRCPVRQILLVRNARYFSRIYRELFWRGTPFGAKAEFKLRRWLVLRSLRRADLVMFPSQALRDEAMPPGKIQLKKALVNSYGVSAPAEHPRRTGQAHQNPGRLNGRPVRLLYVSLYYEYKNLGTLLKALPLLNQQEGITYTLRTTADPGLELGRSTVTHVADLALARQSDIAKWVDFAGPLEIDETQLLYREADIFVFPSIVESFGHPMAEAMAHGLPIVAADTPVNREVCGDAALYFSPLDPSDLADKVRRVTVDQDLAERLSAAGPRRAATRFRWEDHIARLGKALEDLSRSGPP